MRFSIIIPAIQIEIIHPNVRCVQRLKGKFFEYWEVPTW